MPILDVILKQILFLILFAPVLRPHLFQKCRSNGFAVGLAQLHLCPSRSEQDMLLELSVELVPEF